MAFNKFSTLFMLSTFQLYFVYWKTFFHNENKKSSFWGFIFQKINKEKIQKCFNGKIQIIFSCSTTSQFLDFNIKLNSRVLINSFWFITFLLKSICRGTILTIKLACCLIAIFLMILFQSPTLIIHYQFLWKCFFYCYWISHT